ncbi:hypothetical protein EDC04DRAFT_1725547 [Pisolithus marmoratus]|nr:hypothetical protein EDC04DRAFT_1725547 [Pisolithus marmoratus]
MSQLPAYQYRTIDEPPAYQSLEDYDVDLEGGQPQRSRSVRGSAVLATLAPPPLTPPPVPEEALALTGAENDSKEQPEESDSVYTLELETPTASRRSRKGVVIAVVIVVVIVGAVVGGVVGGTTKGAGGSPAGTSSTVGTPAAATTTSGSSSGGNSNTAQVAIPATSSTPSPTATGTSPNSGASAINSGLVSISGTSNAPSATATLVTSGSIPQDTGSSIPGTSGALSNVTTGSSPADGFVVPAGVSSNDIP